MINYAARVTCSSAVFASLLISEARSAAIASMASRNAKGICDLESHDRAPIGDPPAEVSSLTAFAPRVIDGPSTVSDSRLPEYEATKGSKAVSWKRGREAGAELA